MIDINSKRKVSAIFLVIAIICTALSLIAYGSALMLVSIGGASFLLSIYILLLDIAQSVSKAEGGKNE